MKMILMIDRIGGATWIGSYSSFLKKDGYKWLAQDPPPPSALLFNRMNSRCFFVNSGYKIRFAKEKSIYPDLKGTYFI